MHIDKSILSNLVVIIFDNKNYKDSIYEVEIIDEEIHFSTPFPGNKPKKVKLDTYINFLRNYKINKII